MSATDSIVKAAAGTGVDAAAAEQSLKKGYPHEPLATRSLDFNPVHWYEAVEKHWRGGTLNYPMGIYITLCHYWALIGCARLTSVSAPTLLWAYVLWPITGLGITAGVHRLWSHRSYTAGPFLRCLLMLMNSIANQGSIYHWARDHRVHHKHSETPADPHNATRGFFFAHMGWLYVKKDPAIHVEGKKLDFSDLARDPFVTFQKALDPWFALFMCFVFPGLVAKFGWGEDFWNALWVAGALRYVVVLHATWMVNSAAHLFGDHPYDAQWPAENPFVSLAAIGEGWHNWHHKYPYDYAASEFGVSSQFNPTKLFIDIACALGLASNRKRATNAWGRTKQRRDEGGTESALTPAAKAAADYAATATTKKAD